MTDPELMGIVLTLTKLRDQMVLEAGTDHKKEIVIRAFSYTMNRIAEGNAKTEAEVKLAFASFADGFCTGVHTATGIPHTE